MKKVAIVYTTKYGHTKQYVDWLAAWLGKDDADVINVASFNPTQILAYKLIIFASGVYGDKMPIMEFIKKNIISISSTKTMIMAVTWYTNGSEEATSKIIADNFPEQMKYKTPLFVLNSGVDKKKVSPVDVMKLVAAQVMIEKKTGRSNDDINILSVLKGYFDPTSESELDGIKKAIDTYFNPKKNDTSFATASKSSSSVPKPAISSIETVPTPAPTPVPKPIVSSIETAPKPVDVREMKSDADALSSLENAFKALKAPKDIEIKPEPVVEAKPEPVAEVKPEPVVEFKPEPAIEVKPEPKAQDRPNPKVAPAPPGASSQLIKGSTTTQAEVVSSVRSAIRAMSKGTITSYAPAPAFGEVKPEDVSKLSNIDMNYYTDEKTEVIEENTVPVIGKIDLSIESGTSWDSVTKSDEEIRQEVVKETLIPDPVPTAKSASTSTDAPKNSYMELFAKRRRKAADEAATQLNQEVEVKNEPIPVVIPSPISEMSATPAEASVANDMLSEFDYISGTAKQADVQPVKSSPVVETAAVDMDVYDFMDENKPKASSRVLNAVQDLAKAKADAERDAIKNNSSVIIKPSEKVSLIEKMKQDMTVLAEESQHEIEGGSVSIADDDVIEGFTFSNDVDYDLSEIEIDTPPIGEVSLETIHRLDDEPDTGSTDFNLKKLQEEINASIESNRANKEKMLRRQARKHREEVYNPFAVQFDEDESKSKKRRKKELDEPIRLADPIDPDIFFSRPTRNADLMMPSDSMPEIKFRKR